MIDVRTGSFTCLGKRFVADWMPNGRSSVFLGRETDTDTDATADTDTDT